MACLQEPFPWERLTMFCHRLRADGIHPCNDDAELVAQRFCTEYGLPWPFDFDDMGDLLCQLSCPDVFFVHGMEEEQGVRGAWISLGSLVRIFVDAERPRASQVKTVLHEIAEMILAISNDLDPRFRVPEGRARENWASRFAAMIKMPPGRFAAQALETGADPRLLAELNRDTMAGVGRQLRDITMRGRPFYMARLRLERNPARNCPSLLSTLEATRGLCVRVEDVVRTRQVPIRRPAKGALPRYTLPTCNDYRVMHGAMEQYTRIPRAVYIPRLNGSAAWEGGWWDLCGEDDLAIIIRPYGYQRVRGFFLVAVHPSDAEILAPQLERIRADRHSDIPWLFSRARCIRRRPRRVRTQPFLDLTDNAGKGLEAGGSELQRWPMPQSDRVSVQVSSEPLSPP